MGMPALAANEHDLVDSPGYRLAERVLIHAMRIIEKRDVRLEAGSCEAPHPFPRELSRQPLPKRFELAQPTAADQHERTASRPPTKTGSPVEGNFKWWHSHIANRPAGRALQIQPTEKEQ